MTDLRELSEIVLQFVNKNIIDCHRCTLCDKYDGSRWRYSCKHVVCGDCAELCTSCVKCLAHYGLKTEKPVLDPALTRRVEYTRMHLATFGIDVNQRDQQTVQQKVDDISNLKKISPDDATVVDKDTLAWLAVLEAEKNQKNDTPSLSPECSKTDIETSNVNNVQMPQINMDSDTSDDDGTTKHETLTVIAQVHRSCNENGEEMEKKNLQKSDGITDCCVPSARGSTSVWVWSIHRRPHPSLPVCSQEHNP